MPCTSFHQPHSVHQRKIDSLHDRTVNVDPRVLVGKADDGPSGRRHGHIRRKVGLEQQTVTACRYLLEPFVEKFLSRYLKLCRLLYFLLRKFFFEP